MWTYCQVLRWIDLWRRLGERQSSERNPASLIQAGTACLRFFRSHGGLPAPDRIQHALP